MVFLLKNLTNTPRGVHAETWNPRGVFVGKRVVTKQLD